MRFLCFVLPPSILFGCGARYNVQADLPQPLPPHWLFEKYDAPETLLHRNSLVAPPFVPLESNGMKSALPNTMRQPGRYWGSVPTLSYTKPCLAAAAAQCSGVWIWPLLGPHHTLFVNALLPSYGAVVVVVVVVVVGQGDVAAQLVVVLGLVPHLEAMLPVEPSEPTQS